MQRSVWSNRQRLQHDDRETVVADRYGLQEAVGGRYIGQRVAALAGVGLQLRNRLQSAECFWQFGGTSESTQIIAAVYALAENAAIQTGPSYFWKHHKR